MDRQQTLVDTDPGAEVQGAPEGRPTSSKVGWALLLVVSFVLIGAALLVTLGALIPGLGLLSVLGGLVAATVSPHFVLLGAAVSVVGLVARRRGLRKSGGAALGLGGIGLVSNAVIVAVLIGTVNQADGSVNLASATFGLSGISAADPDETHVYTRTESGEDLTVDVYHAADAGTGSDQKPAVMQVHGGGWSEGDPRHTAAQNRELADNGYTVLGVTYELAEEGDPTWDRAQQHVTCAASWIADHAEDLQVDLDRFAYWGDSAGGNLALNTAYSAAQGTAESSCGGTAPVPGAVVTDYPGVDMEAIYEGDFPVEGMTGADFTRTYTGGSPSEYPERYEATSTERFISADAPATLIVEPTQDTLVPTDSVLSFAETAAEAGVPIELVEIPFSWHIFDQLAHNSIGYQAHTSLGLQFLEEQLGRPER
ncbi:alpha/beta hydrolase [Nocardiopsis salina]|uniref:alpha/beta hydrolase n=1 Tax=Nocardiopsis salina TaxID=245836 RepID=UPI000344E69B|nr:alpha/beta hydrolase [Nocardiopsis salina]